MWFNFHFFSLYGNLLKRSGHLPYWKLGLFKLSTFYRLWLAHMGDQVLCIGRKVLSDALSMGLYNLSYQTKAFFTCKGSKFVIIAHGYPFLNSFWKKRSNRNKNICLILSMALDVHVSSFSRHWCLLLIFYTISW